MFIACRLEAQIDMNREKYKGGTMKRLMLMTVFISFLAGCGASSQMIKPEQPPVLTATPNSALLVIVRDTFFGGAITFYNYLDGKPIGETRGNTYIVKQVSPGPHYVMVASENTAVAYLDFQPNKRYFLREGVTMGVWRARTSGFSPVPGAEAMESIKGCAYLELDPAAKPGGLDPAVYKQAVDEYTADANVNPDGYKDMLNYKGE
jgi:Protein of unknown function (DUF2846)